MPEVTTVAVEKTNKIDDVLSLAISVQSKPGNYALLLGSGVSRAAGIPTGWGVVLELIRRLQVLKGVTFENEEKLLSWYRAEFNREPEYSDLLQELAPETSERTNLLEGFFELNDPDDKSAGKPTKAHKAIAAMVKKGLIKIIVTTNFDRLMEEALNAEGVNPVVVDDLSDIYTTPPIQHNQCTVIKVHGDYKSTNLKNSPVELNEYDETWNLYLQRIFEEYGLIVCGWSGECDGALRKLLTDPMAKKKYSTFWCHHGALKNDSEQVIDARRARVMKIKDADAFFGNLEESISALEDLTRNKKPIDAAIADQKIKNFLSDVTAGSKLHDFVLEEARKALDKLPAPKDFDPENGEQIYAIENSMLVICQIFATASYWNRSALLKIEDCGDVWKKVAKLFKISETGKSSFTIYPLVLLFYSAGIAATYGNNYAIMKELFAVTGYDFFGKHLAHFCLQGQSLNKYCFRQLETIMMDKIIFDKSTYVHSFDMFDFLFSIALCKPFLKSPESLNIRAVPVTRLGNELGGMGWRHIYDEVFSDVLKQGGNYSPLQFIGDLDDFVNLREQYKNLIK